MYIDPTPAAQRTGEQCVHNTLSGSVSSVRDPMGQGSHFGIEGQRSASFLGAPRGFLRSALGLGAVWGSEVA
eukprot:9471770-Pyramimonas_sp.AAC.1